MRVLPTQKGLSFRRLSRCGGPLVVVIFLGQGRVMRLDELQITTVAVISSLFDCAKLLGGPLVLVRHCYCFEFELDALSAF